MDLAAGIAGLVSLGIQVTQGIVSYYTDYKSRESDVASTTRKLNRLLDIFKSLKAHLDGRKFKEDEKDLKSTIEGALEECKDCIDELSTIHNKLLKCDSATGLRATASSTVRKLAYPFRKSTILAIEENVDDATSHISLTLQALQLKRNDGIKDDLADNKALLELIQARQVSFNIRNWLKAPDVSINYNAAIKKRHEGTGDWLTKSQQFVKWLAKPNSFLWLYGFAGCGKSVLCSTAIKHTLRHRDSNPRIGLAFFFFTFTDKEKQDASAMLRAVILQLSSQSSEAHDHLTGLHNNYPNAAPPDQALLDCLHQIIQSFDETYILLDALDESPYSTHRDGLLQTLVDIRSWSAHGLHLLVTSRDEIDIKKVLCNELQSAPGERVSLKNDGIDRDIASYIAGALKNDRRMKKWELYHDRIKDSLTKRAKGVFRWVECQFISLATCPGSESKLDRLLESLPRSLDETYERMLLNLDDDTKDDARRILMLLCCAFQPLSVSEIIDAVAVQLGDNPHFDAKARLFGADDLLQICPGFIEVTGREEEDEKYSIVRIAHFSVQEYLESERIHQKSPIASFGIVPSNAHMEMVTICVVYLESADDYTRSPNFYFTTYAAQHWPRHYDCATHHNRQDHDRQSSQNDKGLGQLHQLIFRLFPCINGDARDWRIRTGPRRKFFVSSLVSPGARDSQLVSFLAYYGLYPVLAELLQHNPPASLDPAFIPQLVNTRSETIGTPLLAVIKGFEPLVDDVRRDNLFRTFQFLMEMGATVLTEKGLLQLAAKRGLLDVVHIILDHGTNIDAFDEFGRSALNYAAGRGHHEVVKLLLDRGANINLYNKKSGTALYAAAFEGCSNIVTQLLDRGADVSIRGGRHGSALQAAACGGQYDIVTQLLDRGADVNMQGGLSGSALQAAARKGSVSVIRLLHASGADVNLTGGRYGSALQAAAAGGNADVVRLLLQMGANLYKVDGEHGTAIQTAAAFGHWEVFQLLLNRGADVDTGGGPYGSILHAAAFGESLDVVKFLLGRGADATAITGQYGTVLQAAMADHDAEERIFVKANGRSHLELEEIIQLLVGHGADVNAADGVHETTLVLAALNRPKSTVELLLSLGANVNEQSIRFCSVLGAAVHGDNVDVTQTLLDHGADINVQCRKYGNILNMAMAEMWTRAGMIQLLLDRGADASHLSDLEKEKIPLILESHPDELLAIIFR